MRLMSRLLSGGALALLGTQAFALTGEEVWANQNSYLAGLGVKVSQTQTRAGNVLTVSDISYDVTFPFGVGDMSLRAAPQVYTENADGSVSIDLGDANSFAVAATFRPDDLTEISLSANIDITWTGLRATATGTANDVTYVTTADLIEITLADLTISGAPEADGVDVDVYLSVADSVSSTQITTGDTTVMRGTATSGQAITDFGSSFFGDILSKTVSLQSGTETTFDLTLPAGPMNLMNISQALRDGLALAATVNTGPSQSQAVTTVNGEVITNQTTNIGSQSSMVSFDAAGLAISGDAVDARVALTASPEIPFALDMTIGQVEYRFALPVNASDQPVDVVYAIGMSELTLNEDLWAMVDPAGTFPRDPMSLDIDLAGSVIILTDLLDINAMTSVIDAGQMPFAVQSVTINNLSANAVGAALAGSGRFTLDMTDLTTFDGFPRPEGTATATMTGVNALLDKLVAAGLMTADDAMAGRLGMGMFAEVTGEDQLRSTLEINAEGEVIANGQRIK